MSKNRIIGVTGVTGVGKDFLVAAANADSKVRTVNLGSVIGEKLALDRDVMMSSADPDSITAAQFAAYREVSSLQPGIITCHAIREAANGLAFNMEMEKILNPTAYVFVSAPGELIADRVERRNSIGERKSPLLTPAQLEEEQEAKLILMRQLTTVLVCNLFVLENTDPMYVENVRVMRQQIGIICTRGAEL